MKIQLTRAVEVRGINPYIFVFKKEAARIKQQWRRPMPVLVKINSGSSTSWRTNMMPDGGGNFYLYLHGQMRQVSGAKVGDTITIELEFDDEYRNGPLHDIPDWFSKALNESPTAKSNWHKLSPSRQKEVLRYFANLKSEEAKSRNRKRAISALEGNVTRFMGRTWQNGT